MKSAEAHNWNDFGVIQPNAAFIREGVQKMETLKTFVTKGSGGSRAFQRFSNVVQETSQELRISTKRLNNDIYV